ERDQVLDLDAVALLADPEGDGDRHAVGEEEAEHADQVEEEPPAEVEGREHYSVTDRCVRRMRDASSATIFSAISGSAEISFANSFRNSRIATIGVSAVTVAVRGPPSRSDTSPKKSPG